MTRTTAIGVFSSAVTQSLQFLQRIQEKSELLVELPPQLVRAGGEGGGGGGSGGAVLQMLPTNTTAAAPPTPIHPSLPLTHRLPLTNFEAPPIKSCSPLRTVFGNLSHDFSS